VDHVVIGSGISGLACAAYLARLGRRCLVLEQHYVAGGCLHVFADKGYEWDTGVHYLGVMEPPLTWTTMLRPILARPLRFFRLGTQETGHACDAIYVDGKDEAATPIPAGERQFVEYLTSLFPDSRFRLRLWLVFTKIASAGLALLVLPKLVPRSLQWLLSLALYPARKLFLETTSEVWAKRLIPNPKLRAMLLAQFGDAGTAPADLPIAMHAGVIHHYINGGYYPTGGPQEMARSIVPVIEAAGGRVLVRAEVKEILTDDSGRACGVCLRDGTSVRCASVISSVGLPWTAALLPAQARAKLLPPAAPCTAAGGDARVREGVSHVYVFVGLRGSSAELRLPSHNIWHLPSESTGFDLSRMVGRFKALGPDGNATAEAVAEVGGMCFIGFPSAKDPDFAARFPGKSTAVLLTEADPRWFEEHRGERAGHRSASYQAKKDWYARWMMEAMFRHLPHLRDKVERVEVATPLSNEHYLGRLSSYGLHTDTHRFSPALSGTALRPATAVPGLYLTGQDVISPGVVGGLLAGVLTSHAVAGYSLADLLLGGRSLLRELARVPHPAVQLGMADAPPAVVDHETGQEL